MESRIEKKLPGKKPKSRFTLIYTAFILLALFGCATKNQDLIESGFSLPLTESRIIDLPVISVYMGREMPCRIYFPKGYGGGNDYPVWYGLHSYGSIETMWINAGITESADKLIESTTIDPIIMVFPYTRYATSKEIKQDFEDDGKFDERNMDRFIWKELVPFIDSRYDTVRSASGRYIGGLSMGGAIALRVAFHHTDLFSKVGGYTPAITSGDYSDRQLEKWLYPNDDVSKINDVVEFAGKKGLDKLAVYLDAGNTNDPFFPGVKSLNEALQKRGIKSGFHPYNGGHSLEHNNRDFENYLRFYTGRE
ncbi:MAG: hypothetical protein JXB88_23275 [Spirochaetales bacterium]|nr:hypothetical protein [Spirochaetales bacterium]